MTSTNDGKDVKSNQTSGPKGKSYYIELYKSLEAGLGSDCELHERTQHLCEAWRRIYSLCQHSAPSTHPHLLSWLQKHTARTVLQTEWQAPLSTNEHHRLHDAIDEFIKECKSHPSVRNGPPAWETQLVARGEWFKRILSNPWGHPVLRVLLDPRGEPPSDAEILEWLKEERGVMFVTRLRQLAASKCDDLALSLSSAIMDRVRACAVLPPDADTEKPTVIMPKDKSSKSEKKPTFEDILKTDAGFTVDVWEVLTDVEFVLLHKRGNQSRCIELAKQTPLRNGYQLVERLQSRLETSPREKKLWKNAKEVATLIAQVVITRCMVVPVCSGASRTALYCCARSLVRVLGARLPPAARALAAPAATARHLHTLAAAVDAQSTQEMKPFVCELYVRAITAGMNELERLKLKTEKAAEARSAEQTLASWFTQLGALLQASERIRCECILTAFSVHPTPSMFDRIKIAPPLPPVAVDVHENKDEPTSEFGSWASDSRSQTNFVKTSETLKLKKHSQHQANVLSTAIFSEGEALGISPELCQDIAVLLSGPRLKTLSWDMDRDVLLENCRVYMERTNFGTRALTTELKYLNLDPRQFEHLPVEEDDDTDIYYGIEKGYEHMVEEYQDPEEIWQDAADPERTDSAHSSDADQEIQAKPKKSLKKSRKVISSDDDSDPLSLVAEAKRVEKKKERPHSKERSKEPKKSKSKQKPKDPLEIKEPGTEIKKESGTEIKKEPKKKRERKKKEKPAPSTPTTSSLSSLIGLKVTKAKQVDTLDHTIPTSVTDTDCDSQGKFSIDSATLETLETDVLFDGLFSMDELKSPEKNPDNLELLKNNELYFANGTVGFNSPAVGKSIDNQNRYDVAQYRTNTPTVSNKINTPTIVHGTNTAVMLDRSSTPTMSNRCPTPSMSKRCNTPKISSRTNVPQTEMYTLGQGKRTTVNDDVKSSISKLIHFRRQKTLSESEQLSPIAPNIVHTNSCNPNEIEKPIIIAHKTMQSQVSPKPITVTDTPKVYINKTQSEQLSELRNEVNNMLSAKTYGIPKAVIQYSPKSLLASPDTSGVRVQNPNVAEKTIQDAIKIQYSPPKPPARRTESQLSSPTNVSNKQKCSEKASPQNFHIFLKELQESINAGAGSKSKKDIKAISRVTPVVPTNKAEHTTSPQCAKQSQKKSENLNTFSRLSYLHKTKADLKSKQAIDSRIEYQAKALQNHPNVIELNRLMAEQKNAKAKYMQNHSDSVVKGSNASYQTHENVQSLLKNYEKPKLTNTAKDNPLIANILATSTQTAVKPENQYKNVLIDRPRDLTISTKVSSLTERDQQDLLLLLRQQTKQNRNHPRQKIDVKERTQAPQTTTGNMPVVNFALPSASQFTSKNKILDTGTVFTNANFKQLSNPSPSMKPSNFNQSDVKVPHTKSLNMVKTEQNITKTTEQKIQKVNSDIEPKSNKQKPLSTIKSSTDKSQKGTDWEKVMDAILSHKTPSRGPNALDMALNKDTYNNSLTDSLRTQRIVRQNSTGDSVKTTKVQTKSDQPHHNPNILKRSISDTVIKTNKNNNPPKPTSKVVQKPTTVINTAPNLIKPMQPEIPKTQVQTEKRSSQGKHQIEVLKKIPNKTQEKQFTLPYHKEEDPFISGLPFTDYDLLEELMDDDLRQEIRELSSDEDNFKVPMHGLKNSKTYSINRPITPIIQKGKHLNTTVINTIPCQKKPIQKVSCESLKTTFDPNVQIQQTYEFTHAKINNNAVDTASVQTANIVQMPKNMSNQQKICNNPSYNVTTNQIRTSEPTKTFVSATPQQTAVTVITQQKSINKQSFNVNTNQIRTVDQTKTLVSVAPQQTALQNVVLIGSDIVYQPCTVKTSIHTVQNTYVAYNNQPNMTIFQSTQFTAPVVNPLIIGNAITLPMAAAPVNVQSATPTPVNVPSKMATKPSKANIPVHKKQEVTNEVIQDNVVNNDPKDIKLVPKSNQVDYPDQDYTQKSVKENNNNKNCDRKVLSEVQEKQKLAFSEKVESRNTRSQSKISLDCELIKEESKDPERIQKKRLAILNRTICHRSDDKPIPLSYAPITINVDSNLTQVNQNNETDKNTSIQSAIKSKDIIGDRIEEMPVETKVAKITNGIDSNENCKENKDNSRRRILSRSSKSVVTIDSESNKNISLPRKTSKVRLKPAFTESEDKTEEHCSDEAKKSTGKTSKRRIPKTTTPGKKVKKLETKRKIGKYHLKRIVKVQQTSQNSTNQKAQEIEKNLGVQSNLIDIENQNEKVKSPNPDTLMSLMDIPDVDELLGGDEGDIDEGLSDYCSSPSILHQDDTLTQLLKNDSTESTVADNTVICQKEAEINDVPLLTKTCTSSKDNETVENSHSKVIKETSEKVGDADQNTTNTDIVQEIESYIRKLEDQRTNNVVDKDVNERLDLDCTEIMFNSKDDDENLSPQPKVQTPEVNSPITKLNKTSNHNEVATNNQPEIICLDEDDDDQPTDTNKEIRRETLNTNKVLKNNSENTSHKNIKKKIHDDIPQSFKDGITIEDLPHLNTADPMKKCVRITLPNGKTFKATVHGQMHVDPETLFADPALKSVLMSNVSKRKRYTLNITQLSTTTKDQPEKILESRIQEIYLQTNIPSTGKVETIDLISDSDEENNDQYFTTEFGKYKTRSMKRKLLTKHQRVFDKKCIVKLKNEDLKKYQTSQSQNKHKLETSVQGNPIMEESPSAVTSNTGKSTEHPDVQTFIKTAVPPAVQLEVSPNFRHIPEPTVEPIAQHISETVVQPVLQKIFLPIIQADVQTNVQPRDQAIIQPAVQPVIQPAVERAIQPVDQAQKDANQTKSLPTEPDIIEIDDSSNDDSETNSSKLNKDEEEYQINLLRSFEEKINKSKTVTEKINEVPAEKMNDPKPVDEKINEFKNLLFKDLGIEDFGDNSQSSDKTILSFTGAPFASDIEAPLSNDSSSRIFTSPECFVKLTKCDDLVRKYESLKMLKQCFVKLVRCEEIDKSGADEVAYADEVIDISTESAMDVPLSRCGSFSILTDLGLFENQPSALTCLFRSTSPVMEAYEIIASVGIQKQNKNVSDLETWTCNSDWFSTKREVYLQHKDAPAVYDSAVKFKVEELQENPLFDAIFNTNCNTSTAYDVNLTEMVNVPTLMSLLTKFFQNNPIVYQLKYVTPTNTTPNKNSYSYNLKRKSLDAFEMRSKISKTTEVLESEDSFDAASVKLEVETINECSDTNKNNEIVRHKCHNIGDDKRIVSEDIKEIIENVVSPMDKMLAVESTYDVDKNEFTNIITDTKSEVSITKEETIASHFGDTSKENGSFSILGEGGSTQFGVFIKNENLQFENDTDKRGENCCKDDDIISKDTDQDIKNVLDEQIENIYKLDSISKETEVENTYEECSSKNITEEVHATFKLTELDNNNGSSDEKKNISRDFTITEEKDMVIENISEQQICKAGDAIDETTVNMTKVCDVTLSSQSNLDKEAVCEKQIQGICEDSNATLPNTKVKNDERINIVNNSLPEGTNLDEESKDTDVIREWAEPKCEIRNENNFEDDDTIIIHVVLDLDSENLAQKDSENIPEEHSVNPCNNFAKDSEAIDIDMGHITEEHTNNICSESNSKSDEITPETDVLEINNCVTESGSMYNETDLEIKNHSVDHSKNINCKKENGNTCESAVINPVVCKLNGEVIRERNCEYLIEIKTGETTVNDAFKTIDTDVFLNKCEENKSEVTETVLNDGYKEDGNEVVATNKEIKNTDMLEDVTAIEKTSEVHEDSQILADQNKNTKILDHEYTLITEAGDGDKELLNQNQTIELAFDVDEKKAQDTDEIGSVHDSLTNKGKVDETFVINLQNDLLGDTAEVRSNSSHVLVEDIVDMGSDEIVGDELPQTDFVSATITTEKSNIQQSMLPTNADVSEINCEKLVPIQNQETNTKLVDNDGTYDDDSHQFINVIEYEDAEMGTCYIIPVNTTISGPVKNDLSGEILQMTQKPCEDDKIEDIDMKLNKPKITYSKKHPNGVDLDSLFSDKRKKRSLKRKIEMSDVKIFEKKYRKGKNIDYPKITIATMRDSSYGKEFHQLLDYCSSVTFSYSRPFHKEYIDVHSALRGWPIKGISNAEVCKTEKDKSLFTDTDDVTNTFHDPTKQTLAEEIVSEYNESQYSSSDIIETNFSMGFGEGSDRVKQNLKDGCGLKFSAATLSDVKQTQPLLLSDNYNNREGVHNPNNYTNKDDSLILQRNIKCIQMKNKVRSFFKKTMSDLSHDWMKQQEKDDIHSNSGGLFDSSDFPYGLNYPDLIQPPVLETTVQVVQVGQLPVSAAAQNPVTCDPRVTQVSNASPSQCSAENSPNDDPQSVIKTEYTELTTADMSIPLAQEYVQHIQSMPVHSQDAMNFSIGDENFRIDVDIKPEIKIELEETPEIKEEITDNYEITDPPPLYERNIMMNNIEYSYESHPVHMAPQTNNMDVMYNYTEKQHESETFPHLKLHLQHQHHQLQQAHDHLEHQQELLQQQQQQQQQKLEQLQQQQQQQQQQQLQQQHKIQQQQHQQQLEEQQKLQQQQHQLQLEQQQKLQQQHQLQLEQQQKLQQQQKQQEQLQQQHQKQLEQQKKLQQHQQQLDQQQKLQQHQQQLEQQQKLQQHQQQQQQLEQQQKLQQQHQQKMEQQQKQQQQLEQQQVKLQQKQQKQLEQQQKKMEHQQKQQQKQMEHQQKQQQKQIEHQQKQQQKQMEHQQKQQQKQLEQQKLEQHQKSEQQQQLEQQQQQKPQQQKKQQQQKQQKQQQNGSSEKTDQIAHAMNAAGITPTSETISTSRAHALVNILSQKLRQGAVATGLSSSNNYQKTTSINAMALQQALAQILPPPLNQTSGSENSQQTSNTPQVLHIVQGKNASGNQQITLVDNSQQSVISTPNSTPVLHIVQNKSTPPGTTSNGTPASQTNSFSGLSLVDGGLQQGNQLLHIVNAGNQKNSNAGQLLKRVNLLTNLANVQGGNEQKMVQFVCKSADGKAIQLNGPHQRSMVLRLQPIETPNLQPTQPKVEPQDSPSPTVANNNNKDSSNSEIKSRSVYEENYAKFIQSSSPKTSAPEKGTSLPKFNQAFGKQVYQDGSQKNEISNSNSHLPANGENPDCQPNDNAMNLDHINQISSPPLLLRKPSAQTSQSQTSLVQQLKQTIAPMNIQTMHGGVIYTRQIPVNIGGGQTINLITVPSTDLVDDSNAKQQGDVKFVNQGEVESSIIKIVPQTQSQQSSNTDASGEDNNNHPAPSNETPHTPQPQPVLTQMRIKLPMLSKNPGMVSGTRVVRPSFFQIQRNVIGGANQPVYQQLVLTAAPSIGQQTIRLPQAQTSRPVKTPSESQSSTESMSSSTLEQLREFDLVLEQVKERSTVQPNATSKGPFSKLAKASTDTTDSPASTSTTTSSPPAEPTPSTSTSTSNSQPAPHTQHQVLYSIGNTQPLSVTYVNRKTPAPTATTSSFVRSPDSSGIIDSPPTSSTHVNIPHTVTSDSSTTEPPAQTKSSKSSSKSKSRPKAASNPPSTLKLNTVPPKTSTQKPLEDEQTTQRILYILAEYKEQVENSPDKDKPAPRRRTNPPSNPGSSKRKKSSSSSRRRDMSPIHGDDTCRTMGSEDSSCGTSQGDCNESCMDSHSPQDSPRKVVRKLTFDNETPIAQPRPTQPQRNVIVADGQTITVARGTAGKPSTAVLMPANYILPVSMIKGGQQIAIVTNRGPKLLTVGESGATNALLLQRLIGPAGLKPVLTRPGVRHVRLPTTALHNLQGFNLATATTTQPPDSTASPAPAPTPPELVDTKSNSSPWRDREIPEVKPERTSSPEGSEPWHLPHDYGYEETVRTDNMDRTVLDPIPDRYSPDMEAQRIFDKMFDVDSKKSYMVGSHDDSPRCGYDIDASDCDDKAYHQVVQKKDGSHPRQHRLTHVSAAALRHKYAILEHELRLQKSLSEECEDLGVDSPSASELFPEAELLFSSSPAHDHTQDQGHHSHTPQPLLSQSGIPQPDMDDQIATDQLLPRGDMHDDRADLGIGLEDVDIVAVSEDGTATITLDQEEFARSHPNTTFHSEPTDDGEVQPFTISGLKSRHITSTIFHANRAPGTVLMTAPQATVISQATAETSGVQNTVKYADIDNMINSIPGTHSHSNNINLSSVLVKDEGLTRFDSILNDNRELHLSNTASAIVHATGNNTTQVIRRVCYDNKRGHTSRFLMDEPDGLIAGEDAKMMADDSRDFGDVDDDRSSPERNTELFWESNSASEREYRRPLDYSSDSDKCCKSPSYDETNSTDSSGVGAHMRLDSVIKDARGIERSGSADGSSADDTHPPLRTYPPKRLYHGETERSMSGKTRAGERSPDSLEVRRRASGRGVVKRGCHCCNGSPAPPRPKKPRQRKPNMDFSTTH